MVITLAGSAKVDTRTLQLQLITPEGNHISDVTLQPAGDRDHFTASITPRVPVRSFKLKLKGTTRGGYPFERISRQTVKPTTAVLRGKYASNEYTLPLGRVTYTHFQLCNFGNTETFDVTVVKDKLSYVITPRLNPKRVIKGRCVIFSVRARATRSQDVETTDFVFVVAKGRLSGVVVRQTMTLFVVS